MVALSLANRKIVLTQPLLQASALEQALQTVGCDVQRIPVIRIVPYQSCLNDRAFSSVTALVFMSVHAAQYFFKYYPDCLDYLPIDIKVYAIGAATAKHLCNYGLVAVVPSVPNSESLCAMDCLQNINGEKFLIVRGLGGRRYIKNILKNRGAQVESIAVYKRVLDEEAQIVWQALLSSYDIDAIIVSSLTALGFLHEITAGQDQSFLDIPLCVIGNRVKKRARQLNHSDIITASCMQSSEIIKVLSKHYNL